MAQDEATGSETETQLTRVEQFARWSGRGLIFMTVLLFIVLWAWFFIRALLASQYSWAFGSLLLFALFLLASTISPRGRAARLELALASARVLIEYEAPKQAEAVVEKIMEAIPVEAKKAFAEAKPRLLEETVRAFHTLSERATLQALASSSALAMSPVSSGELPGGITWSTSTPLTWEDLEDPRRAELIRGAIIRRLGRKPTDPSSGSAR